MKDLIKKRWYAVAILAAAFVAAIMCACSNHETHGTNELIQTEEPIKTIDPAATAEITVPPEVTATPELTETTEPTSIQLTEEEKEIVLGIIRNEEALTKKSFEIDGMIFTADEDRNIFYEGEYIGNQHHIYEMIDRCGEKNNPERDGYFIVYRNETLECWYCGALIYSHTIKLEANPIRAFTLYGKALILMPDKIIADRDGKLEVIYEGNCDSYKVKELNRCIMINVYYKNSFDATIQANMDGSIHISVSED